MLLKTDGDIHILHVLYAFACQQSWGCSYLSRTLQGPEFMNWYEIMFD